jgi:AcrR family transcriptional regulator
MRLFGEQGYAATTVAQIEAAAGLVDGRQEEDQES